jgi:ADP-ribosylglycohydrolase
MRGAPIGLYFETNRRTIDEIDMIGAETAAITHGHELGYIPAAGLVHIVQLLSHNEDISLLDAVLDMKEALRRQFTNRKHLSEQIDLIDKAIALSKEDIDDLEAIRELGQGWVAEETLAIAIYCSLKYSDDFDKAIIASVNHSGDSDSTGAVTGNLLGAYLGLKGIPQKYLDNLELKDVILEIADDLYNDCKISEYGSYHDEIWEQKYIYKTYKRTK